MVKLLTKIGDGPRGYWFTGDAFYRSRASAAAGGESDLLPQDRVRLVELLAERSFHLNRWQGEPGLFGPVSVGFHSFLVGALAERLGEVRGIAPEICQVAGDIHDLGETTGIGDVSSPWLRAVPAMREVNDRSQRAVEGLLRFGWHGKGVTSVVKDADHLAAYIERRYLFGDDSGDMEAPGMDDLISELRLEILLGRVGGGFWLELLALRRRRERLAMLSTPDHHDLLSAWRDHVGVLNV